MGDSTNLPLEGLRSLVDLTGEAACLVDASTWRIEFANSPLARLTGIAVESLAGRSLFELVPELQDAAVRAQLAELAAGKRDVGADRFPQCGGTRGQPVRRDSRATRGDRDRSVVGDGLGNGVGRCGG